MRVLFLLVLIISLVPFLTGCSADNVIKELATTSCSDLIDDEKWQEALVCFTNNLSEKPGDSDALGKRAWCYYQLSNYGRALADANAALKIEPNNAYALHARGAIEYQLGEYQKAIADFSKELEVDPEDHAPLLVRADCYISVHNLDQAVADFDKYLEHEPDDAAAYIARGDVYLRQDECKKAIEDFQAASQHDDSKDEAVRCLARAYMRLGLYEQALKDLAGSLDSNPTDQTTYIYQGIAHLLAGDRQAALDSFSVAHEWQSSPTGDLALADLYLYLMHKLGNDEKAARADLADTGHAESSTLPHAIALYLNGTIDEQALSNMAVSDDEKCQTHFWIGMHKRLLQPKGGGQAEFQWLKEKSEGTQPEYELAHYLLKHEAFPLNSKTNSSS